MTAVIFRGCSVVSSAKQNSYKPFKRRTWDQRGSFPGNFRHGKGQRGEKYENGFQKQYYLGQTLCVCVRVCVQRIEARRDADFPVRML